MIDESEKYIFKKYEEDEWQLLDSNENVESHIDSDDLLSFEKI